MAPYRGKVAVVRGRSQEVLRGGPLIFDDYARVGTPDELSRPRPAIDAFLQVYLGAYTLLHQHYQVAIERTE